MVSRFAQPTACRVEELDQSPLAWGIGRGNQPFNL
jgi:hypothetical protein